MTPGACFITCPSCRRLWETVNLMMWLPSFGVWAFFWRMLGFWFFIICAFIRLLHGISQADFLFFIVTSFLQLWARISCTEEQLQGPPVSPGAKHLKWKETLPRKRVRLMMTKRGSGSVRPRLYVASVRTFLWGPVIPRRWLCKTFLWLYAIVSTVLFLVPNLSPAWWLLYSNLNSANEAPTNARAVEFLS